ncbi:hypothetical protein SAMN04488005_1470 [Yoonia tamlensis]|uniref:Uncharacterized protein n=1 Tax=Yoonia tamlensis TaxID=390270 RepID=A0A1I6GDQ1_9RHOB|nr:hypothetical protein [Yoonia tamlensis]SFR40251.1 hypothetical protein SAMN04488005_1470 [Yoonia tamlensis]
MLRLIKVVLFLAVLAGVGLVAFAYIGPIFMPHDFAAPTSEVTHPVTLDTH